MGKGDRRTKRGKLFRGTFGKSRTQRTGASVLPAAPVKKAAKVAKADAPKKEAAPKKKAAKKKAE
jgi:30S ribosomal protein S31